MKNPQISLILADSEKKRKKRKKGFEPRIALIARIWGKRKILNHRFTRIFTDLGKEEDEEEKARRTLHRLKRKDIGIRRLRSVFLVRLFFASLCELWAFAVNICLEE
jgi:hypothetical protein